MPTLNWIGKESVVNHDKEVPFRLLKKVKSNSVGENSGNLIIRGDNLEALKALMPYYQGKIKCIYIDPPYNTGNENWVYNDKVNSPKIKKWLGKVVGGESEDLCRHDKWLCMMYPRLKLLRELLSDDGVILISINDSEVHHLRLLLSDIFQNENFIAQIVWENKEGGGSSDSKHFKIKHEYILTYAKNKDLLSVKGIKIEDEERYGLQDKFVKERGNYQLVKLNSASIQYSKSLDYPIKAPDGTEIYPSYGEKKACWRWSKEKLKWGMENEFIVIKKDSRGEWAVYTKQYLHVDNEGNIIQRTNRPFAVINKFSSTMATKNLEDLFEKKTFNYSKPYLLLNYLFSLITNKDSIILDSFAGSGTTGHAVMDLNKEDGGNRKFILIEMEDYAKDITSERIKRAIKKYEYNDGFDYCELSKPLFDETGKIDDECTFEQLATYLYFIETNTNIDLKQISKASIGNYNGTEIYLLFKEKGKNIFNKEFFKKLPTDNSRKIVYADRCLVDESTAAGLSIFPVLGDMCEVVRDTGSPAPELIVCVGDTLTHLATLDQVACLIRDSAAALVPGGHVILSFRDYSTARVGPDRFIPVRSDSNRVFTCFLEFGPTHLAVHDIVYVRTAETWAMTVSAFEKIRLAPSFVRDQLQAAGLTVLLDELSAGLATFIARKPAG